MALGRSPRRRRAWSEAALLREVRHLIQADWSSDWFARSDALPPPPWPEAVMDLLVRELLCWRSNARAVGAGEVAFMQLVATTGKPRRAEWWGARIVPLLDSPYLAHGPLGRLIEGLGFALGSIDRRPSGARLRATLGRFLLEHPNPNVRADAIYALGMSRTREAAALLARAARDRGTFWFGNVGAYARAYRRAVLGDDAAPFRFRHRPPSAAWYAKRKLQDAAWVRAARAAHARASASQATRGAPRRKRTPTSSTRRSKATRPARTRPRT